ncbi:ATP-dependent RNA helicase DDX24-like isoform X1 [Uloborus diversus]|uniref:ATP-dependent RNA helicase DDX24-like isoform X1 n=1 Tax=Uloborus diversus TaxID=327109 RepID=UPI00240A969D|nr:ATP-dependent RNA helicase DDX24-like isoform X1 [Uloborus diversus]XP_054720064.1 ATP-dependent RNA helicase DDX24-like isoform X1 [Uloborus diversus]
MKRKWKPVDIDPELVASEEFDGFGGIEELTDYELIGLKNNSLKQEKETKKKKKGQKKPKLAKNEDVKVEEENNDVEESDSVDMSAWSFLIPEPITHALKDLKFTKPTPIQELAIPFGLSHKDILGAAETGSGKTLAFGIPIISHILGSKEKYKNSGGERVQNPLSCLVLTPTRELAIQVKKHLQAICKFCDVTVAAVVGGMAPEKQKRLLKKHPDIVVATPGRLWELIEEGEDHVKNVASVKYLVIDEADRMLEKGHFAELMQILGLINGNASNTRRQTFVFSATLTLVHDIPERVAMKKNKGKMHQKKKIDSFIKVIGMKENHKVIDVTKKTGVAETLTESQIMCSIEEKDLYLYYFLITYPGRTLVFCNSIDCVRRLRNVLEGLNCKPLPLHASMHQRQRLKNLDKFSSSKNSVLLATDVAARGLDIKGIEHVIHFQVPRTAETYVHRSGRTARAQNEGLSLMLIDPQESTHYRRICKTLNKDKSLPTFPIDNNKLRILKERVNLARKIDKMEHRVKRLTAQNRWFINAAKEMDVDIDDENLLNDLGSEQEHAAKNREINSLKKRLKSMLSQPVCNKLLTGCYPTKSGKLMRVITEDPEKAVHVAKKRRKK